MDDQPTACRHSTHRHSAPPHCAQCANTQPSPRRCAPDVWPRQRRCESLCCALPRHEVSHRAGSRRAPPRPRLNPHEVPQGWTLHLGSFPHEVPHHKLCRHPSATPLKNLQSRHTQSRSAESALPEPTFPPDTDFSPASSSPSASSSRRPASIRSASRSRPVSYAGITWSSTAASGEALSDAACSVGVCG